MKSMMYKYLDHLPLIPDDLIRQYRPFADPNKFGTGIQNPYDPLPGQAHHARFNLSNNLLDWLHDNITNDTENDCSVAYTYGNQSAPYPVAHRLHRDTKRNWVLMYLVYPGGEDVVTSFYQQQDQPLSIPIGNRPDIDPSKLTLIDSVVVETRRWFLLNAMIIHDVKNIISPRISIQVGSINNVFC